MAEFRKTDRRDSVPFTAAMLAGLTAHAFMMTNKIPVDDDICHLFSKGATTVSGRWGLEILRLIMPDVSMPWIYGLMALILLAAAVCLTVRLFEIESPVLQALLAGVFVTFPAETGTMSYLFTAAPYALALLLSVSAVLLFRQGKRLRWLLCPMLIIFSCSIYQGYFGFSAAFCVLLMIRELLDDRQTTGEILKDGLKMLLLLVISVGIYGLTVILAGRVTGTLTSDVINQEQSILMRAAVAYSAFLHTLFSGYFAYVNTGASRILHAVLLAVTAISAILSVKEYRDVRRTGLLCLCLFLLPLACYCLYLLADNGYIHSLALYPFAAIYVLFALAADRVFPGRIREYRTVAAAAMALVMLGNIYFANSFYLYSDLQYENTKAFYSGLMTRVMNTEGFDDASRLAVIGERGEAMYDQEEKFDFENFQLPGNNITENAHTEDLLSYYLGWDIPFADAEECAAIEQTEEFRQMPVYPYDGSVKKIGETVAVKLS